MADDETPARLKAKSTWLISQVAARSHGLLTERLAAAGARGYHYRLLAALAEFGPSRRRSASWPLRGSWNGPRTRPTGAATSSR